MPNALIEDDGFITVFPPVPTELTDEEIDRLNEEWLDGVSEGME